MQMSPAISRPARTTSAGVELRVRHQRPGRGQGIRAAGADRQHVVRGGDHVAGAAEEQQVLAIQHDQHGFEPAQDAIRPPFLRQFGRGLGHRALVVAELGLEAFEQREGIGGGPGEARPALCRRRACGSSSRRLFITMLPSVTWPSPPMAAPAEVRTARMVVARMRGTVKIAPGAANTAQYLDNWTLRRPRSRVRPRESHDTRFVRAAGKTKARKSATRFGRCDHLGGLE